MATVQIPNFGSRVSSYGAIAVDNHASMEVQAIQLNEFVAREFASVPEVECVYTACRENDVLYAWIVVSKYEKSVRTKIYDLQKRIIAEFDDREFDFYIIDKPTAGCDSDQLVSDAELAYRRK